MYIHSDTDGARDKSTQFIFCTFMGARTLTKLPCDSQLNRNLCNASLSSYCSRSSSATFSGENKTTTIPSTRKCQCARAVLLWRILPDVHAQPYMGTNNLVKQRVIKMVGDLEMTKTLVFAAGVSGNTECPRRVVVAPLRRVFRQPPPNINADLF